MLADLKWKKEGEKDESEVLDLCSSLFLLCYTMTLTATLRLKEASCSCTSSLRKQCEERKPSERNRLSSLLLSFGAARCSQTLFPVPSFHCWWFNLVRWFWLLEVTSAFLLVTKTYHICLSLANCAGLNCASVAWINNSYMSQAYYRCEAWQIWLLSYLSISLQYTCPASRNILWCICMWVWPLEKWNIHSEEEQICQS